MKRAIITGVTGAIGMALIQHLLSHNIEVLAICRDGSARNMQLPEHPLLKKCICSLEDLSELQNTQEEVYDVCYHFAWSGTNGTARNDMYLQNNNVRYALDAVEMAARFGCKVFIGAGSQAEYGSVEGKIASDTPAFPKTGYGIAKLCAGQMTRERAHQLGMKHIWTRILSVYGPYDGAQSMVMSGIYQLLDGKRPSYTKGEQMWDYLYSGDAAEAFYLLGEKAVEGVYCLGGGSTRPLRDYIEMIRDAVNPEAEVGIGEMPYYENQVMYLCADISALTKATGFVPKVSFETGIGKTVEWCKSQYLEKK